MPEIARLKDLILHTGGQIVAGIVIGAVLIFVIRAFLGRPRGRKHRLYV